MNILFIKNLLYISVLNINTNVKIIDYYTKEELVGVYNRNSKNYSNLDGILSTKMGDTLSLSYISYEDTVITASSNQLVVKLKSIN